MKSRVIEVLILGAFLALAAFLFSGRYEFSGVNGGWVLDRFTGAARSCERYIGVC